MERVIFISGRAACPLTAFATTWLALARMDWGTRALVMREHRLATLETALALGWDAP